MYPTKKKAAVIGTGLGGLAATVRLLAKGYQVEVFEALDQPGGRARVFEMDGYRFDAGPTIVTAPYLLEELFQLLDEKMSDHVELIPNDPFYRIEFFDGTHFDYVGDQDRVLKQISEINPSDVEGYKKLAAHAEQIFKIGYEQLADFPFERLTDMLRIAPAMLKLQNYHSVYDIVAKYIKNENLRMVFSLQPLLVGGNPFRTTSIYLLIHWLEKKWGVYFAKGGTGSIVKALIKLLKEKGVQFNFSTPVEEIFVENGKVKGLKTHNGNHNFDLVVSNGDPSFIYKNLIKKKWRPKHSDRSIDNKSQAMGLFVGYFGTKKKYEDLHHHTIIMGPRYRGLLDDIFVHKKLADDFSLYLHAPTRTDSSLAPKGHDAFYVLSPVPNNLSGVNWKEEGDRYFQKILKYLEDRYMPELSENITTRFFVTPDYFQNELRSIDGSAFGLEPKLTQSAYFRYHNRSEDIEGLYFVGASTHPGAGMPGVLSSAKVLDRVLPHSKDYGSKLFVAPDMGRVEL